jgi:hypothetical protein
VEGAEVYESITGLSDRNSYYNLDITPKQNLLRHGKILASMLHQYDGRHVQFESAEKNQDLVTVDLAGNRVAEGERVPVLRLGERLFLPYIATVTSDLPRNAVDLLTNFPTGYISFTFEERVYKGFIMEATVDVPRN